VGIWLLFSFRRNKGKIFGFDTSFAVFIGNSKPDKTLFSPYFSEQNNLSSKESPNQKPYLPY
jgi:hypothetical protein